MLSDCIRPNSEVTPGVIDEIKHLEVEHAQLTRQLEHVRDWLTQFHAYLVWDRDLTTASRVQAFLSRTDDARSGPVSHTKHLDALAAVLDDRPAGRNIIEHAIETITRLQQERDAALSPCVYTTTIDGYPEDPHYHEARPAFPPTYCPHCGRRVMMTR